MNGPVVWAAGGAIVPAGRIVTRTRRAAGVARSRKRGCPETGGQAVLVSVRRQRVQMSVLTVLPLFTSLKR